MDILGYFEDILVLKVPVCLLDSGTFQVGTPVGIFQSVKGPLCFPVCPHLKFEMLNVTLHFIDI